MNQSKPGSGGKRAGAGRKPLHPPARPRYFNITDEQARLLRIWGKGDMSAGLRWLIDAAQKFVRRAEVPKA